MATPDQQRVTTPTIALFAFVFVTQFIQTFYSAFQVDPPATFQLLNLAGFLWAITWWLKSDSKRTGSTWPLDFGMFLYVAWIVILPYHLLKTRGVKGLLGILSFAGVIFAAWLTVVIIVTLVWY